ncbi:MAG: tetratricopeptide repeat protein [Planctomycetota bacterium]|nr:tetratricopeptide repeat protein [Planctomycetota bacterium]
MLSRSLVLLPLLLALLAAPVAEAAPGNMPPRARAAYQALQRGDLETAQKESAEAVRQSEKSSPAWMVRGFVLSRSGDKPGAEAAYRQAIVLDPSNPVARNNLGTVLLDQGKPDRALRAFNAALSLHPFYADARNNAGAALEKLGRAAAARRNYRLATVIDPKHAKAYNNLGAAQLRAGDVQAASSSFARAARLDPSFDAPALNLALLGARGRNDEEYLARLQRAAAQPDATPSLKARVLAMLAGREADQRNWDRARELYLEALTHTPRDTTLLNNVAVVEDQLGMDREALLHLTEALDIDPDLKIAQNNIGIVHVHRGKLDLAESVFTDLLRQDANFHRAHYNLGVIQASRGEVADARRSFQRAARLAPRDAAVRYNLAILARSDDGDARAELRAYEEVLRLDANLVEAHLAIGMLLADPATSARLRNPERAVRHLRRFLELAPPSDTEGRQQATDWLAWLASQRD